MVNGQSKNLIFFFGSLALFVVALAAGINLALKRLPGEERPAGLNLPPPTAGIKPAAPAEGDGQKFRIINPGSVDQRGVTYTEFGFEPAVITIRADDPLGCLIVVTNKSGLTIRVGVNPHHPAGDPGADYGELRAGKTGIYDVRYSGFEEILLHNHFAPSHEFRVRYGQGCR